MGRSAGRPLSLKAIESVAIYDGCCPPNSEVAAGARGSQIRQLHRKRIAEGSLGGADCGEPAECGGRASPGAPSPIEAIDVIVVVDLGGGSCSGARCGVRTAWVGGRVCCIRAVCCVIERRACGTHRMDLVGSHPVCSRPEWTHVVREDVAAKRSRTLQTEVAMRPKPDAAHCS